MAARDKAEPKFISGRRDLAWRLFHRLVYQTLTSLERRRPREDSLCEKPKCHRAADIILLYLMHA